MSETDSLVRAYDIRARLAEAYGTALGQQNGGARVEIHVGTETLRQMKELCTVAEPAPHMSGAIPMCWGFPVIEEPAAATLHLSVHTVHTIA